MGFQSFMLILIFQNLYATSTTFTAHLKEPYGSKLERIYHIISGCSSGGGGGCGCSGSCKYKCH